MFEKLKELGEAFKTFGKNDEVEVDDQTTEKDTTEIIKTKSDEKEKKKDTEETLEKKLKNIEKVIDTFGSKPTVLPSGQLPGSNINADINQRPLDMGQVQAKAQQTEYLKPSSVPNDRIALLYEDLKKYNLI